MIDPTPTDDNALAIAVIFKDFAIDHTPDGWPAVKQMHLNAAAAELERQHAEIERLTGQLAREQEARRDAQTRLIDMQELAARSGLAHRKAAQEAVAEAVAAERAKRIKAQTENEALKYKVAKSEVVQRRAVFEAVREALQEAQKACENLPAPESCSGVERSLWDVAMMACAEAVGKVGAT